MKKSLLWIVVLVLSISMVAMFSFTGCKTTTAAVTTAAETTTASNASKTIVYIAGGLQNPSAKIITEAMMDENTKNYGYDLKILDGESRPEKQLELLETASAMKPALIALSPQDTVGPLTVIKKFVESGIPFLSCEFPMDKSADFNYFAVGGDQYLEGKLAGEYISKILPQNAKVVHITGNLGNISQVQRDAGFKDVLSAQRKDVKIVAWGAADWDRAKAMAFMEDTLQVHPDIDAVYAIDDTMALGALQALTAAGLNGKVIIIGDNGQKEALQEIQKGNMTATVYMPLDVEGRMIVQLADKIIKGEEFPTTEQRGTCKVNIINPIIIDKNNVDQYINIAK